MSAAFEPTINSDCTRDDSGTPAYSLGVQPLSSTRKPETSCQHTIVIKFIEVSPMGKRPLGKDREDGAPHCHPALSKMDGYV